MGFAPHMRRVALTALVAVISAVAPTLAAQGGQSPNGPSTAIADGARANRDGFVIGPGALLRLTVTDRPDLSKVYRVDAAGTVLFPSLGSIRVDGVSLRAASDELADRLTSTGASPVKVRVEFDRSLQSVFVAGQVRSPGLVTMKGPCR